MLNESKGNMYGFVNYTWNAIKGRCQHDCLYCYMKIFPQKEVRLDEKEFTTDLGRDNYIFVGSSTDMFAENIPEEWINKVLDYCRNFSNTYLFQSKNPERFFQFIKRFPHKTILCTTIETNREGYNYKAPTVHSRLLAIQGLKLLGCKTMITIEPVIDFDVEEFASWINTADPDYINIGADSKGHNLPEPSKEKIDALQRLIKGKITIKSNLERINKPKVGV